MQPLREDRSKDKESRNAADLILYKGKETIERQKNAKSGKEVNYMRNRLKER